MTKTDVFKQAVAWLEEQDYEAHYRHEYSGRGMFGKDTPAIVTNAPGPMVGWAVAMAIIDLRDGAVGSQWDLEEESKFVPRSSDHMGMDIVYY